MEIGEGGYQPDIELVTKSSESAESEQKQLGGREYQSGKTIRALDENKQELVDWTVLRTESENTLKLVRTLANGETRSRQIAIERISDEQEQGKEVEQQDAA